MSAPPRILILTAAYGEGHNSAARNLARALEARGAVARVCDPCLEATPRMTGVLERLYRFATDHLPRAWKAVYDSMDRFDFNRDPLGLTKAPQALLERIIDSFQPMAVVGTYPIYPYLMARITAKTGRKIPVFVVVTDSIEINSAWTRAPGDWWLVTDPVTRELLAARAPLRPDRVIDTGFPVNPVFSQLSPLPVTTPCDPFRVLFFPTSRRQMLEPMAGAMLDASPAVRLTLVLGRNVRVLLPAALRLRRAYPGRVRVRGWTRRVPELLASHHAVVGKAGGATVHEAIAACCPMLIHHLVPGQEEGNLALLEKLGAGGLAATPGALGSWIDRMLAGGGTLWRDMKNALTHYNRNTGALAAAKVVLEKSASANDPIP